MHSRFDNLPPDKKGYTEFVNISNKTGAELLSSKPRPDTKTADIDEVATVRKATLRASTENIQASQNNLRETFDHCVDRHINNTLLSFENGTASSSAIKNAWSIVKELGGKRTRSTIFVEGEDRLKTWENHFKNLLNADPDSRANDDVNIVNIFDTFPFIKCGNFSQEEVNTSIRQMKNGKSPGLDGLPPEFWKLKKMKKY